MEYIRPVRINTRLLPNSRRIYGEIQRDRIKGLLLVLLFNSNITKRQLCDELNNQFPHLFLDSSYGKPINTLLNTNTIERYYNGSCYKYSLSVSTLDKLRNFDTDKYNNWLDYLTSKNKA